MPYRPYPTPPAHLRDLVGELPEDHLARLVEQVVEEFVVPAPKAPSKGNPEYDPRLCAKVLIYGYPTGTRSSRQLERLCQENLAYLYLCRGDAPSCGHASLARLRRSPPTLPFAGSLLQLVT